MDRGLVPGASAPTDEANAQVRRLDDGREFRVVKIYHEAEDLLAKLVGLEWRCDLRATDRYFIFAAADRTA